MSLKLLKYVREKGDRIAISGKEPVMLDKDFIWFVDSGDIDIFLVDLKGCKPISSRFYFLRILSQQLIFPLPCPKLGVKEKGFIGVGTEETKLIRLELSLFKELVNEKDYQAEIADLVDDWIAITSSYIEKDFSKYMDIVNISEESSKISETKSITSADKTFWCNVPSKACLQGGIELLKFNANSLFPISKNTLIDLNDECVINPIKTIEFLKDPTFINNILNFDQIMVEYILFSSRKYKELQKEGFRKSNIEDKNKFSNALSLLSSSFQRKKDVILDVTSSDKLHAAIQILGHHEKVKFNFSDSVAKNEDTEARLRLIVEISNLRSRKIILKDKWYKNDTGGSIIGFLEDGMTPVAILRKSPKKYMLCDPKTNKKILIDEKVNKTLVPFAYSIYDSFPECELNIKSLFKFSAKGNFNNILSIIVLGLIAALLGLLTPIATGYIFDTVIPEAARGQLLQIAVILFTCGITTSLLSFTKSVATQRFSSRAGYRVEAALWDRLLALPVSFFKDYTAGDLAQRAMGIGAIREIMDNVVISVIMNSFFSIGYLLLLFYYSVSLAFMGLFLSIILIIFSSGMSILALKYQKKLVALEGEISGLLLQFITGISKLRTGGAENRAFGVWAKKLSVKDHLSMNTGIINNVISIFNSIFPIFASITIFIWVILKLEQGSLTAGSYMGFNSAYLSLQGALLAMSGTFISILSVSPIYKRLLPIFKTLPEVNSAKPSPGTLDGNLEVSQLSFKYGPHEPIVLDQVSLGIKKGEFVAIVGSSGCGKSTLFRLFLGFENPMHGTVSYDDNDLSAINIKAVRRQLGVVLQNSSLIQGSIFDNIVGSAPLSIGDAWEAARMAGCDKDIEEMPMGMHTILAADGSTISGGQKQRIIIARALARKPKILLFDEATSALDNRTQAIVSKTVESLKVTRVVIAHRLSTIINADRIYVLNKGRIVQEGNYHKLIAEDGLFAQLAKRQMA